MRHISVYLAFLALYGFFLTTQAAQGFLQGYPIQQQKGSEIETPDETQFDDTFKSVRDICLQNGYKYEDHWITTSDGYILQLMRIPGKFNTTINANPKPVILMQHGMGGDAAEFIINYASKTPGFQMVEAGYDVWLGNNRGCKNSLNHTSLKPQDAEFWNFDFDEMGIYDVPATIDYILNITGQRNLTYLGHSMGASQMIAGLSLIPDYYKEKLNLFVAFGPATRLKNTKSPFFRYAAQFLNYFKFLIIDTLHYYHFYEPNMLEAIMKSQLYKLLPEIFIKEMQAFETNPDFIDDTRTEVYVTHFPSGTGWRCIFHYTQLIDQDAFYRYDYKSAAENMKVYGQRNAPKYDLTNVTKSGVPIALYAGELDELADVLDIEWFRDQVGPSSIVEYKRYENIGHLGFVINKDMTYFKKDVIPIIEKYSTKQVIENIIQ